MSVKSCTLTDLSTELWLDRFSIDQNCGMKLAGSSEWSIHKRTLRGGVSEGVDVVTVNNGVLSFDVVPTRGMGLWRGHCQGVRLGWDSPARFPVHPTFVNQVAQNGCGWMTGFNEWICRCGLETLGRPATPPSGSDHSTADNFTLHGHIANIPANYVAAEVRDEDRGYLKITGRIDESHLFGPNFLLETSIESEVGSKSLTIRDRVTNRGSQPREVELMYHMNFGAPILSSASRIVASVIEIASYDKQAAASINSWSSFQEPTSGFIEQCYFLKLAEDAHGNTSVLLYNENLGLGVLLSFCLAELPCFTLWKHTAGLGDGYVTGLEPGTNYPLPKSFERQNGRLTRLMPGMSYEASMHISIITDHESLGAIKSQILSVQPHSSVLLRNHIDN
jgi:galactose mutarotase-like enzyme